MTIILGTEVKIKIIKSNISERMKYNEFFVDYSLRCKSTDTGVTCIINFILKLKGRALFEIQ